MDPEKPETDEAPALICVDKNYNEVDCADPSAAYHTTREDAKAKQDVLNAPPEPVVEEEKPEQKAVVAAPANKAVQPKGKKSAEEIEEIDAALAERHRLRGSK